jgi:tetratricopeptide (TPR) repeat protein
MNKISNQAVEEYQKILAADPNSKVFAVLAEAYREMGIVEQAENLVRRGVSKNPTYAPGYVVWGRLLLQKKDFSGAVKVLKKAVEFSPDNLLAYQLLGEAHLQLKEPKEALKAHKMALFLNPHHERSKDVVKKLEILTAEEFADDEFEMKPLQTTVKTATPKNLELQLSVVDALIVRQELLKARTRLLELQSQYPGETQVTSRLEMIAANDDLEEAEEIKPLVSREKAVLEQKIQKLKNLLRSIEELRG